MTRPTINFVKQKFINEIKGKTIALPTTSNKGLAGQTLDILLDIPNSSACLDCSDGEVKLFPLKRLKNGELVPKETIAITMSGLNSNTISEPIAWEESALKKKTNNMLFISYLREKNSISFCDYYSFDSTHTEYEQFKEDYEVITNHYKDNGIRPKGNTINGKYIQGRTKGPGGSSKKSVAFYFRTKEFVKSIILSQ